MATVGSVLASSGFWAFLKSRDSQKNATINLLLGLAYKEVVNLGLGYIDRGWITTGELGEYGKYYFHPYKALGGNGPAERIWNQVNQLPIRQHNRYETIFRNEERVISNVPVISRSIEQDSAAE